MKYNKHIYAFLHVVYIALLPLWIMTTEWQLLLAGYVIYWLLGDWIISLFLHKHGAHNLWTPPNWLKYILSFFGAAIMQGTALSWAAWHRTHHKYVDTEKDPHSPIYKSLFYIVFMNHYHSADYRLGVDRARDSFYMWMNKYEGIIALAVPAILYMVLPLQLFLSLWVAPVIILNIMSGYIINWVCHKNNKANNIPWVWPFVFSEAMHADHHHMAKLVVNKYDIFARLITRLGWART